MKKIILLLFIFSTSIMAISFNIDIGVDLGTPSDNFGAASGQIGFWNNINPRTGNLFDLEGHLTGVQYEFVSDSIGNAHSGSTIVDADSRLLSSDHSRANVGNPWSFELTGLENGEYRIFYYAPSDPAVVSGDFTANSVIANNISGDFTSDDYVQGVNFDIVNVDVTNGSLLLSATSANALQGLAGLQVVAVPEPSTYIAMLLGLAMLFSYRTRNSS